jgi:hypothetical protein
MTLGQELATEVARIARHYKANGPTQQMSWSICFMVARPNVFFVY